MAVIARLEALLTAETKHFDKAMATSETKMHKVGRVAGVAGLAIADGLAVGLEKSVHAAVDAQASQARLAQAFKDAHLSLSPYTAAIDKAEKSGRKLGFTDADTRDSLARLLTATHNYSGAAKELAVAQDIARFKSVSLTDATKMLTMAQTGSQRAAKQLGITVPTVTSAYDALKAAHSKMVTVMHAHGAATQKLTVDTAFMTSAQGKAEAAQAKLTDKLKTGQLVIEETRQHVLGQGKAYAETAAGGMAQFHAQLDHLEVTIGQKLIPALTGVLEKVTNFITYLSDHPTVAKAFAIGLGLVAAGFIAVSIASAAATIAASPWLAIGAAIVVGLIAIAAGLMYAWKHSETFRAVVTGVFQAVKTVVADVISGILWYIDKWLAAFQFVMEAASHIPKIGDKFKDAANGIQVARDKLQGFRDDLAAVHDKTVKVHVNLSFGGALGDVRGGGSHGDGLIGAIGDGAQAWVQANPNAWMPMRVPGDVSTSGLMPWMFDDLALGHAYGLRLSSGYRQGARTVTGNVSLHSVGEAIDMTGSEAAMHAYAHAEAGRPGVVEVIHSPEWWHPGSGWGRITNAAIMHGHYSHTHVGATSWGDGLVGALKSYDRGGWLMPGLTLAANNTGRPERVGGGDVIINLPNYLGERREVMSWLQNAAQEFKRRNGRSPF